MLGSEGSASGVASGGGSRASLAHAGNTPKSVVVRDKCMDKAQVAKLGQWLGQHVMEEDIVDALM